MFINNYVLPIMRWLFIFGVPILLFLLGMFFLVKIFFLPTFFSGRKREEKTNKAKVLGKREEVLANPSGLVTLYFVTFELDNDILELMVPKGYYKSLNYGDKGDLSHKGDRFNKFVIIERSSEKSEGQSKIVGDTMRSTLNEIAQKNKE